MFDLLHHVFDVVSQIRPVNTRQNAHKRKKRHTEPTNIFMGLNVSPWHCRFLLAPTYVAEETGEGVYWLSGHCCYSQLEWRL